MARYGSNDRLNLKVGVSSFSEEKTSLEVVGRIGLNTDAAMQDLDVRGNVYISGSIGIGTSTPSDAVDTNNTAVVNVGVVTANEFYGSGLGLTGITSATNATNIYGGATGQILYQAQPGVTSAFENGTTGFGLFSRGSGQPPQWLAAAPAGAIEGLLVFDEGSAVGVGTTYSGLDFRGLDVVATGGNNGGIRLLEAGANKWTIGNDQSDDKLFFYEFTNNQTRMVIESDGKVGIGEDSPLATLHVKEGDSGLSSLNSSGTNLFLEANGANAAGITLASGNTANGFIIFGDSDSNFRGAIQYDHSAEDKMYLTTAGTQRLAIDNSGRVGIGTLNPSSSFNVSSDGEMVITFEADANNSGQENCYIKFLTDGETQEGIVGMDNNDGTSLFNGNTENAMVFGCRSNLPVVFATNNLERMGITADGNVGIGVAIGDVAGQLHMSAGDQQVSRGILLDNNRPQNNSEFIRFRKRSGTTAVTASHQLGAIEFAGWDGDEYHLGAVISAEADGSSNFSNNSPKGRILFKTIDGSDPNPTERVRVEGGGNVGIGTNDPASRLHVEDANGNAPCLTLELTGGGGKIIAFVTNNTENGDISEAAGTVSLNGFQGAHQTNISGSSDTSIKEGTVISTTDILYKQNHPQCKISDTENDTRVYGVLSRYVSGSSDFVVASVGVGAIRVTGSCAGGDLLVSAGDGCAKVNNSATLQTVIGKVTSNTSGSMTEDRLIPCVLYCG